MTRDEHLDALADDIGALRRASVELYGSGIISQGDHARNMLKIIKRERTLMARIDQQFPPPPLRTRVLTGDRPAAARCAPDGPGAGSVPRPHRRGRTGGPRLS